MYCSNFNRYQQNSFEVQMSIFSICNLFCYHSYELRGEGPVQQISYVSDTECGFVRVVSEDELEYRRWDMHEHVKACCVHVECLVH